MGAREVLGDVLDDCYLVPLEEEAPAFYADAVLEKLKSAGWQLCPIEPSEKMIEAGLHAHATNSPYDSPFGPNGSFADQWRAMLKAASEEN